MGMQIVNFRISGDQSWVQSAECAKPAAPSMFPTDADTVGIELARVVCNACPVRPSCLEEAMSRGEADGIWGGLTTEERRNSRRASQRNRARKAKK